MRTGIDFMQYKDVVKSLLHTAGTELFGRYAFIDDRIDNLATLSESAISQT